MANQSHEREPAAPAASEDNALRCHCGSLLARLRARRSRDEMPQVQANNRHCARCGRPWKMFFVDAVMQLRS